MSEPADQERDATSALFLPVAPGRISELIVNQIRNLIIEGRLKPGARLPSERDLAERFQVSRVTVRDALRILEAQGLLEIRVGASGGAFVTAPTAAAVGEGIATMLLMSSITPEDIAEARLLIELGVVALAVLRATDEDIERLRQICIRSQAELREHVYDVKLSAEFHSALALATHNDAVEMTIETFRGPLSMAAARAREPAEESHEHTVAEHIALVDAIEARDIDRAQQIMTKHLLRGLSLDESVVTSLRAVLGS